MIIQEVNVSSLSCIDTSNGIAGLDPRTSGVQVYSLISLNKVSIYTNILYKYVHKFFGGTYYLYPPSKKCCFVFFYAFWQIICQNADKQRYGNMVDLSCADSGSGE